MKKNYFLKHVVAMVAALFMSVNLFAQTAKQPTFVEAIKPVMGETGPEIFTFAFENAAAWGDYNNDGYLDLITVGFSHNWSRKVVLYKNNGDGTFTLIENPFPALNMGNATWFDYNNDGNLDVFLAGRDDIGRYSGLWKNLGPEGDYEFTEVFIGEFEYISNYEYENGNNANRYVVAGDYNNDGWVDLYLQGWNDETRVSLLYKNLGGTGFEKVESPVKGTQPFIQMNAGTAAWGDYDNDGYLDLLASGYGIDADQYNDDYGYEGGYTGALYRNLGNGYFDAPILFLGSEQGDVDWFDYNNDGYLDYIVTGVSHNGNWIWLSDIYENNQNGSFTRITTDQSNLPNNKQETSIALGDVNNDGYEDILYMNADPNSVFLNNYADMTFTKQALHYEWFTPEGDPEPRVDDNGNPITTGSQWGGTACLVDFDNDGDLDAFTSAYGFEPKLLRNDLGTDIPVNQAPTAPANLSVTTEGDVSTFSWDASEDDLTPPEAIKYNLYVKQGDVIKMTLPAHLTTGRLKVNETLAPITTTSYQLSGLTGEYEWGVQAIDNAKNAGAFAVYGSTGIAKVNATSVIVRGEKQAIKVKATGNLTGTVEVYTVSGAKIYSKAGQINNTTVEAPAGIYIVKTISNEGTTVNKAIVK